MQNFNKELALTLIESDNDFPVNFEDAWQWLGYSTKQKARTKLEKDFKVGLDYTLNQTVKSVEGNNGGGSVRYHEIYLTIECFKMLGMMTGTEKGKEIREYFLQCEKELKNTKSQQQSQQQAVTPAILTPLAAVEYTRDMLLDKTGLELPVVQCWVLTMLATKVDTPNKEIYLDAQKLIASRIELPEELVTVTELCKILEGQGTIIKPQTLNKLLCQLGLQTMTRDNKNRIVYQLTEASEGMGKLILNSTGTGKNVAQLKWYASKVLKAIKIAADSIK